MEKRHAQYSNTPLRVPLLLLCILCVSAVRIRNKSNKRVTIHIGRDIMDFINRQ